MRHRDIARPLRTGALVALTLLAGCTRDCAGPGASTVATARGSNWSATLLCTPRTRLGAGRGDLLSRKGCTAAITLRVDGAQGSAELSAHEVMRDRDCARVRAYCRLLPGRIAARGFAHGTAVGADVAGMTWSLVLAVSGEGVAFDPRPLPSAGRVEAALAREPSPDEHLREMLARGAFEHGGSARATAAMRGATLARLREPLRDAATRCAAPGEALARWVRGDPASFEFLFAHGWTGARCEKIRDALESAAPTQVEARVTPLLASRREGAAAYELDPLVVTAGSLRIRGARYEVAAIARAPRGTGGVNEALWIHALWAWSRIDAVEAGTAAVEMLRAAPASASPPARVRAFGGRPPRWDPPSHVLAACAASGGPELIPALAALARDPSAPTPSRRLAALALAELDRPAAQSLERELSLGPAGR